MSDLILGFIGVVIGCVLLISLHVASYCYRGMVLKKEAAKTKDDAGWFIMSAYRDSVKLQREMKRNKPDRLLSTMKNGFDTLKEKDRAETSGMTYEERIKHPSWEGKPFAVKMNYWQGEVNRRKRSGNYKNIYPSM